MRSADCRSESATAEAAAPETPAPRPDERGRLGGRDDFSLPLTDIRNVVISRARSLRLGAMAFIDLEGGGVQIATRTRAIRYP